MKNSFSSIMYEVDLIGVVTIAIDLNNKYLNEMGKLSHANVSLAFKNKVVASRREELLGSMISTGKHIFSEELIRNEPHSTV